MSCRLPLRLDIQSIQYHDTSMGNMSVSDTFGCFEDQTEAVFFVHRYPTIHCRCQLAVDHMTNSFQAPPLLCMPLFRFLNRLIASCELTKDTTRPFQR
jgi:hypothetical protein